MSDDFRDSLGYMIGQIQSGWWTDPEKAKPNFNEGYVLKEGEGFSYTRSVSDAFLDNNGDFEITDLTSIGESIRSWVQSDEFKNIDTSICKPQCQHNWNKEYYFSNTKPFETCSVCGKKKEDL